MKRPGQILVLAALLAASLPAAAWNAGGHRLTAAVAWRQMDAATRAAVGELLSRHPDYARWLKRARSPDADPAYAAFLEASTWPDDIKRDPRFHDADEAPTAPLSYFPDMERHRRWHHVDQPLAGPARNVGNGELDRRLAALMRGVADERVAPARRAYDLAWLIHLVGDAHQPLHVVSRYDAAGEGDDGGNTLWIDVPQHPRRRSLTLHAYWDDLPGPPWLRGERLEAAADALATAAKAKDLGTVGQWLEEGRKLAVTAVYDGLDGEVPTVSDAYHERATRTARERVVLAGRRLGLLLQKLLTR